jgi:hypothetical protein
MRLAQGGGGGELIVHPPSVSLSVVCGEAVRIAQAMFRLSSMKSMAGYYPRAGGIRSLSFAYQHILSNLNAAVAERVF